MTRLFINDSQSCIHINQSVLAHCSELSPSVGPCSLTKLWSWSPSLPCRVYPWQHSTVQILAQTTENKKKSTRWNQQFCRSTSLQHNISRAPKHCGVWTRPSSIHKQPAAL